MCISKINSRFFHSQNLENLKNKTKLSFRRYKSCYVSHTEQINFN